MTDTLSVKAENYVTHFSYISSTLIKFHRIHRFEKELYEVDVLPKMWSLAIGTLKPGQVSLPGLHKEISIENNSAVFIPPFTPIRWHIHPGILEFDAFFSYYELPPDLPKQPILLKWDSTWKPRKESEIFQIIKNAKDP
ncbi:MAG: hypothetical protein KDD40_05095, partial [Bdellovibrionales bacterium]|nr:hypothetical protein [Bdellovibrionales bacterium]